LLHSLPQRLPPQQLLSGSEEAGEVAVAAAAAAAHRQHCHLCQCRQLRRHHYHIATAAAAEQAAKQHWAMQCLGRSSAV
jgi:hypothetical protein